MVADGLSKSAACRVAAAELRRGAEAVKFRVTKVLGGRLEAALQALRAPAPGDGAAAAPAVVQAEAAQVVPVAAPVAATPAAPVVRAKLPPLDLARGAVQRALWAELNTLGYGGGWSAGLDLDILKGLARGEKIGAIAVDLGFDSAAVQARFARLRDAMLTATCADRVTIDGQRALLQALQARHAWFAGEAND